MKGKARVELRDAKSGRLIKCIEKHNIVTNAAFNVMKAYNMVGNMGDSDMTLLQHYFGGVLLFGASIDESENKGIPSAAERLSFIGKASSTFTPTGEPFSGTYISAESSITAHNATLVFSFDTGQGNGNINCICLTSAEGGVSGYGATIGRTNYLSFKTPSSVSQLYYNDGSNTTLLYGDDTVEQVYSGNKYVSDITTVKDLKVRLNTRDTGNYIYFTKAERTYSSFSYNSYFYTDYWDDHSMDEDRAITGAKTDRNVVTIQTYTVGDDALDEFTYDCTNLLADIRQKGYETAASNLFYQSSAWAVWGKYIFISVYFNSKRHLYIVNTEKNTFIGGAEIPDFSIANTGYDPIFRSVIDAPYMFLRYNQNSSYYLGYRILPDTAEIVSYPEFITQYPTRVLTTKVNSGVSPLLNDGQGYIVVPQAYLATINNVDTLEKNASRTLKIIYNLEY